MHMLLWIMSDRAIPRSLRMIEGFGVHTFRFVNAEGVSQFVKFHWRPKLGAAAVLWDEAVKINGADPDFHRRDLWEAIARGDFPEWELGVQVLDEATAASLEFDVLDATKLIPEEIVPLRMIGRLVLNRNVDNFFAETEQVAFLPTNVVPGIDFTDDPLLQGRLFSYQDTQLSRLGGANFHQIPVNAPRCPMHNFQRDGMRQMAVPRGRIHYEPNSLDGGAPRENPQEGFVSHPEALDGEKLRRRAETFADHYSQARMFFRSMTVPEQMHIVSAFAFELAKVETRGIRLRMLGHLAVVDTALYHGVASALGMQDPAEPAHPAAKPRDLAPSPSLSLLYKAPVTLMGRTLGVLVTDGVDAVLLKALQDAARKEMATVAIVAPKIGGVRDAEGGLIEATHALSGGPSIFFDTVAILASDAGARLLATQAGAVDWVRDAFVHLKVMGYSEGCQALLDRAGVRPDAGVLLLRSDQDAAGYLATARRGRLWAREATLRVPG